MELYRWLQPLTLCIACQAPFVGVNPQEDAGGITGSSITPTAGQSALSESAGAGGQTVSIHHGGKSSGAAGEGLSGLNETMPIGGSTGHTANFGGQAGQPEIGNDWLCRFESDICQCYADPSAFEPGWLDRADCPNNNWCTLRQGKACVCWANQEQYEGALGNSDTVMVTECPNQ